MPILLLALLLGSLIYMWLARRNSTLTRHCRWRLDRRVGPNHYQCTACGAQTETTPGKTPQDCLRRQIRSDAPPR